MRRLALVLAGTCLTILFGTAQKPVAERTMALFQNRAPQAFTLFTSITDAKEETKQYVDSAFSLNIKLDQLAALRTADAGIVRLVLPHGVELDLYQASIYSEGAEIKTSDGRTFSPNPNHRFYRGMIHGNANSLAIVSVFEERIQILFADEHGNNRIQQMQDGHYLLFADKDIKIPNQMNCFIDDTQITNQNVQSEPSQQRILTGNCIEVYVECDHKSYLDNGSSVPNTEEWVAELWNEVITLYDNEDIPVSVSDVLVYTSSDPFANLNTTNAVLNAFRTHIDTLDYDGRLAHLLSTRGLGGGIAILDVLCSNSYQVAFSSSLSTNIVPFPTYSWTVEVVTHEMGHNVGSPHTHACAWNGNNTALDGCGPAAGYNEGCTAPLPTTGTIMSYCHLVSGVGINFNNGFGTQPGNLIRSKYNNANCNTGTCSPPLCTSLTLPLPGATNVDINQNLFWASADGADGYRLTVGTTPTNGNILNNVDVGDVTTYDLANPLTFSTTIYVKLVPYNELGEATGCTNQSFTTEANVIPLCTALTYPVNGATGIPAYAILTWAHSVGNQTGYKISIGTTLNGTQIANNVNVGNVTTYDHPTDFPYNTILYVKITPYWTGGDILNCTSQSFTTFNPVAGDFCSTAINLPCGGSIDGSTLNALPEVNTPFCGVAIEAPGIWYTFVGNGLNAVIATCSDYDYDTQLNAYQGTCTGLTCVTGIDDFCYTGSQITFPTTNGTTYYILVQGWGGEQGTFTITRSCYSGPFYCLGSGRSPFSEWITNVTFAGDPNPSGQSSYSDFTSTPITVSRGVSYPIQINPGFVQGTRPEHYKVWIDYNHDGDFTDAGEMVFAAGPSNTPVTGTITIPVTATKDTTRMRVAMRYNTAPTTPCVVFENGEVEDYTLNIRCNMVTSAADDGSNGTLRSVCACVDDNESVLFAPSLNGQTINITGTQLIADGIWKWMATAGSNIEIKALNVGRILKIPIGLSAEIQNLRLIGGTAAQGTAIDNLGTLIIRDCEVHPAVGSNIPPIRNTGTMSVFGVCDIMY
ncbi:MAG TPA: GEVED domain-containing protein [Saprospiraceae bacterium]